MSEQAAYNSVNRSLLQPTNQPTTQYCTHNFHLVEFEITNNVGIRCCLTSFDQTQYEGQCDTLNGEFGTLFNFLTHEP